MERPGWSEMYWYYFGSRSAFINSLAFLNFCLIILIISGLFFRKSLRYHHLYSWYMENILRCGVLIFFYDKVIFSPFTMIMFRLSVINPSISLSGYWFIKEVLLWQSDYWRSKLISYTVAYLTIPLLIINNNGDIIDFPRRFLMTSVLSFTREKQKEIRSIINGIFFILFVLWNKTQIYRSYTNFR
jgi:hypothetical protein